MNLTNELPVRTRPHKVALKWPYSKSLLRLRPGRWFLSAAALFVAALVVLVPAYLLMRTLGAEQEGIHLLAKANTFSILLNTFLIIAAVTLAAAAIAIPAAWLTTCTDLAGKRIWTILAALPLVLPSYVAAYVYMTLLAPKGLLQQLIHPLTGIERLPSLLGFPGAFLVLTAICYPFILLTVRAALLRMDPALVEAARSLGLSPRRAFLRVTLPYLRPSIVAGSLLVVLYVLRDFGAVTMWQYSTFTRIIYNRYLSYKLDTAAALALVVVAITVFILFLDTRTRGKRRYGRLSTGAARQRRPVKLGHWRWLAYLFLSILTFVTLVLPALALSYWLLRGWRQEWAVQALGSSTKNLGSLANLVQPAWNSISVSLLAAVLAVFLALPVAILVVRRPNRFNQLIERLTYVSYALPGIVVALALVFFGIHYASSLYQTLPMLLIAYVILFLPQALGSQRSSLLQISPRLEEAARSLGQRPFTAFRKVTFPLALPGVLAGGTLVFLTSMKELPAALILSPLGFSTLSTAVWTNINEAFFARAAAPALLILLLSSLPLALMTLRNR
jgi:iron(III) transport system permease protein